MNLKLVGAVLRKDLRLFRLLAVLTALLNAVASFRANAVPFMLSDYLVQGAAGLASTLLILLVFHADSAVSGKRDWLTRPVLGIALLAAKCVFVALVTLIPAVLGFILLGFRAGRPLAEVLVASVMGGFAGAVLGLLGSVVVAALTSSIRQAIGAFLVCTVLAGTVFGMIGSDKLPDVTGMPPGTVWMLWSTLLWLATFTALGVLWILYRRHHGRPAALVLAGVAILTGGTLTTTMTWSRMFAVQKWLAPDPAAAESVAVSVLPRCLAAPATEVPGDLAAGAELKLPPALFTFRERQRAGADPVGISVRLVVDQIPEGGRLVASRSDLTYRTADGKAVSLGMGRTGLQWVKTESGELAIDQYWLLSKQDYQRLAVEPGTTTHIEYSLSLLQPEATAVFTADGRRGYRPGIGFCGAPEHAFAGEELVTCYVVGDQPALLAVGFEGNSSQEERPGSELDFMPAILDFWGGRDHVIRFDDVAGRQVRVTSYEARAHLNRRFDVPGMLGGTSSCPLPDQ